MFFGKPKANHGNTVFPFGRGEGRHFFGAVSSKQNRIHTAALIVTLALACADSVVLAQTTDCANKIPIGSTSSEQSQPVSIASEYPIRNPVKDSEDPMPKPNKKLLSSTMEIIVNAPQQLIWEKLVNFEAYPNFFPRIDRVTVTKTDGPYVYTESVLKKQLFVSVPKQIIINDLSQKPNKLRWVLLEGNFKDAHGLWELTPVNEGKSCKVRYTLASPHGPIPSTIFGWTLKMVQKDIISDLKREAEKTLKADAKKVQTYLLSSR